MANFVNGGQFVPAASTESGRSRAGDSTPTILAERENFTSEQSERLHKRPEGATSQARLHRDFGEERLSPREDVKLSLSAQ